MPILPRRSSSASLLVSLFLIAPDPHRVTPDPEPLTGRWSGWFRLAAASRLPYPTTAREVSGELRFRPAPEPAQPQDSAAWRPVHEGSSAVEFRPLGFTLGSAETLGWHIAEDTVRIILDPTVDHGHVELVGNRTADEVSGRWQLISDPARAHGEFRLRRLE